MSNFVYTRALARIAAGDLDLNAGATVIRAMLERSTSTYTPNKDHDFVGDLSGFVECSVASYARVTVANKAVNTDDANDRVEFDFDDVNFGNLESGQTVKGIIFYVQTGGDDSTPNDDDLLCYIDTATGLPATLGGGNFSIVINSEGLIQLAG